MGSIVSGEMRTNLLKEQLKVVVAKGKHTKDQAEKKRLRTVYQYLKRSIEILEDSPKTLEENIKETLL